MRENLNIDFQIGFGFELNDYDDAINISLATSPGDVCVGVWSRNASRD